MMLCIGQWGTTSPDLTAAQAKVVAKTWQHRKRVLREDPRTFVGGKEEVPQAKLRDLVEAYLAYCNKESTRRNVRSVLRGLLDERGDIAATDLKASDLLRFLERQNPEL